MPEFWDELPMDWRIRTMWALGNLVAVLLALCVLGRRVVVWLAGVSYVWDVAVAIWHDAQVQPLPDVPAVPIREPGWVLREYKERKAHAEQIRRAEVVERRLQRRLPLRVVRSTPTDRAFAWPG